MKKFIWIGLIVVVVILVVLVIGIFQIPQEIKKNKIKNELEEIKFYTDEANSEHQIRIKDIQLEKFNKNEEIISFFNIGADCQARIQIELYKKGYEFANLNIEPSEFKSKSNKATSLDLSITVPENIETGKYESLIKINCNNNVIEFPSFIDIVEKKDECYDKGFC